MNSISDRTEYFVTCSPGLEAVLFEEAKALRLAKVEQQVGGVCFVGAMGDAWRANLELRTAIRVLRRLDRFSCPDEQALYQAASALDWSQYLTPEGSFFVDAQCRESALDHSQFVAQRTKDAVVDSLRDASGLRPSVAKEDADLRIHVHLWRDRCTLSVDTSGDSLHKRGWRTYQGLAPVAETIAAAMVLKSDWDRRAPLVDPFCGSGTILIEAALIASETAPGIFRSFGFERWPGHDVQAWEALQETVRSRSKMPTKLRLLGRDLDACHCAGVLDHATSIGFAANIEVASGDALDFPWKPKWGATVVSNLPYGVRSGDPESLEQLYREFGASLRDAGSGYFFSLLVGNRQYAHALGFQNWESHPIQNGSLPCRLLLGKLS